jgi:glutaredoxin-like YruB-family protein
MVTVYSTPTCPYCKMAKAYLTENKVEFTDVDVAADDKAAEDMIQKSGQMGVPVLDINGKIIVGFDKDAIKEALGL